MRRGERRSEAAGAIRGLRAILDPTGLRLSASARGGPPFRLARHEERLVEDFTTAIERRPEVLDCFATTGEAD